ncbi:MAG: hypothetical protein JST54_08820 [Deltaproteobacteria bacterium]|nr:hypothetical protein [Deltaproteobacteria bacterium]
MRITFFGRSCSGCRPVRGFLEDEQIAHDFVDVRKAPLDKSRALELARKHQEIAATRGGKLVRVKTIEATDAELEQLVLGREGNLRAPTVSNGKTLLCGFEKRALTALVSDES